MNTTVISSQVRPMIYTQVAVGLNDRTVDLAAEVATTVIMRKFGNALGATRDQVKEVNVVGLKAALAKAVDPDAKIKGIEIPAYFSPMIKGLSVKVGRTVVEATSELKEIKAVDPAYKSTIAQLKALGLTFVKPHTPTESSSDTLAIGVEKVDDVDVFTGNLDKFAVEDLVRRGFLEMTEDSRKTMLQLLGQLGYQYGEVDSLITEYTASASNTAV